MKTAIRGAVYGPLLVVMVGWLFAVSSFRHDDTTTTMRQIVSLQIGVSYDDAKISTTLGELRFDELDFAELIVEIEDAFSIGISDDEIQALGGQYGWKAITVSHLAEFVRAKDVN